MSLRYKLALAIDGLLLALLVTFGGIVYDSRKDLLERASLEARENAVNSLARVAAEALASEDDSTLIAYTLGLRRMIPELEVAYVTDGKKALSHTDKALAPALLPLSGGGGPHSYSNRLLVRKPLPADAPKGVSYSRRILRREGRTYEATVGFSDARVAAARDATMDSLLLSLFKAGALVLAAGTLLAFLIAARMTQPVRALAKAFAATGSGDLSVRLRDSGRRDEIGALTRDFNRMVERLKELDEMKRDFVSAVTHELKSPLAAIESYLDLMAYELAQAKGEPSACAARLPKFLENISFIKQNSERLLRFIGDLLDASKIERGKFEIVRRPGRLEPLISGVVKLFGERARAAGVELRPRVTAALPELQLDPERVSQVLLNLVSNAVKFTPRGGSVTITAAAAGKYARVSVEDTGPGVPKEALQRLFSKFYQAPGSREAATGPKGTGLGLYIARSITEAHGGRMFAENTATGARFGFELPL